MKKIKRITIGLVFLSIIALSLIQSKERSSLDVDLNNLVNLNQAQAEGTETCSWGYRKWNCGAIYGDGVDCNCTERTDVRYDCS